MLEGTNDNEEPQIERRSNHVCYMEEDIRDIKKRVFNGLGKELASALSDVTKTTEKKVDGVRNLVVGILISIVLALVVFIVTSRVEANSALTRDAAITRTLDNLDTRLDYDEIMLGLKEKK